MNYRANREENQACLLISEVQPEMHILTVLKRLIVSLYVRIDSLQEKSS